MKHLKKIVSLLLTVVMVLAMCIPVMADDANYTITIKGNNKVAKSYEAYQVFKGVLSTDGKLTEIEWGKNINEAGKTALLEFGGVTYKSAAELAAALNETNVKDFANEVSKYLTGTAYKNTDNAISIPKTEAGYYFIKNEDRTATVGQAYTKFVLQVVGDTSFTPKTDAPEIEKKIKNADEPDSAYRDSNNVAIGDTVNYKITSKVPDMSNYEQYYFIVNDTLSKGLSYTDGTLKITIDGEDVTATDDDKDKGKTYKLTKSNNQDGTTGLKIVFSNFKQYTKNQDVVITYSATLNDEAVIGNTGNPNNVDLIYSNNPNKKGTGTNQPGPNDEDITGTTPKDWTITYTTDLGIYKHNDENQALNGVEFTMTGLKNNDVTKYIESYTEDESGSYYKLVDGTYTTVVPKELTKKYYDGDKKYKLIVTGGTFTESSDVYSDTISTNENGFAKFKTLAVGKYEIIEIKTKDGYNMLPKPIQVEISCVTPNTVNEGNETAKWTIKVDGVELEANVDKNFDVTHLLDVVNKKGSSLPETGGIGTTIFYVVGVILMLGAGVLLVTKKRMSSNR